MEPGSAGCRKGKVSGHSWTGPSRLRKARVGLAGGHTGCLGQMGPPKRTPALSECLGSPPPNFLSQARTWGLGIRRVHVAAVRQRPAAGGQGRG